MNTRKFIKDGEILWERILCPICGNCTGPQSDCYNLQPQPKTLNHPTLGLVSIFSKSCAFRQDTIWKANLNYEVSSPLVERLSNIDGVKKLYPLDKYSLQIVVGRLFDENKIKAEITQKFKTFIKELQVIELNLTEVPIVEPEGILFPNGESFITDNAVVITELVDSIEGASKIFGNVSKTPEKNV